MKSFDFVISEIVSMSSWVIFKFLQPCRHREKSLPRRRTNSKRPVPVTHSQSRSSSLFSPEFLPAFINASSVISVAIRKTSSNCGKDISLKIVSKPPGVPRNSVYSNVRRRRFLECVDKRRTVSVSDSVRESSCSPSKLWNPSRRASVSAGALIRQSRSPPEPGAVTSTVTRSGKWTTYGLFKSLAVLYDLPWPLYTKCWMHGVELRNEIISWIRIESRDMLSTVNEVMFGSCDNLKGFGNGHPGISMWARRGAGVKEVKKDSKWKTVSHGVHLLTLSSKDSSNGAGMPSAIKKMNSSNSWRIRTWRLNDRNLDIWPWSKSATPAISLTSTSSGSATWMSIGRARDFWRYIWAYSKSVKWDFRLRTSLVQSWGIIPVVSYQVRLANRSVNKEDGSAWTASMKIRASISKLKCSILFRWDLKRSAVPFITSETICGDVTPVWLKRLMS